MAPKGGFFITEHFFTKIIQTQTITYLKNFFASDNRNLIVEIQL